MARKLGESVNSLSEGAARLERIVLSVKARQLAETHNAPALRPASDGFSHSPDEIWSKNYMTVGIGPSQRGSTPMPGVSTAFRLPEQPRGVAKLQPPLVHSPARPAIGATIGEALAKPARRRSWLARLVLGG
jgi:hypothetical protein